MKKFTNLTNIIEVVDEDVTITDFIRSKTTTLEREDEDDAFYVCDVGDVAKKWKRFRKVLPEVKPFYAVKCNPDWVVVQLLADLDVNFDCASEGEIKMVTDIGVSPDRIIYANPCKQISHIKFAKSQGVTMMTFDNKGELYKIKEHYPEAELVIRIKVDDSKSICKLSVKFGASTSDTMDLLKTAMKLELNVIGVSFHVGSHCNDGSSFYEAVSLAKEVFNQGQEVGYSFTLLDIGGGFPGDSDATVTFEECAKHLSRGFDEFFPHRNGLRIIAEPGRYFAASAFSLACNITNIYREDSEYHYFINDGIYGSFNCIYFDGQIPIPYSLNRGDECDKHTSTIWGPSFNSKDCIGSSLLLPKMEVDDWICFDNMGAYTSGAGANTFGGYRERKVAYMCHKKLVQSASCPYNNIYDAINED